MESQAKIKALRAEMAEIRPTLKSPYEDIRNAAHRQYTALGLEIDRELLRQSQRIVSIV